jgi:DNA-binding beta-propeller fold protein YncE
MNSRKSHWCVLVLLVLAAQVALADDYADARAELVAAYQAQDYAAMVAAGHKGVAARPDHPGAKFNLALAQVLNGENEPALATLDQLLDQGIEFGADELDEFAPLRKLDGWTAHAEGLRKLREPQGSAEVAYQLDDGLFVPEGVAIGSDGEFYIGSIRKGLLLRDGQVLSDRQGHWSVFGMRFDDDSSLWFASAAVAQLEDVGEDLGKTGLFRIDTSTGEITHAAVLPQRADEQVLGDLVIMDDLIYTTDSLTGAVYRYDIEADEFSTLVEPGLMRSPQGLVPDETGEYLYVADYTSGLYRVSLRDGAAERVAMPPSTSAYGIDGLYRHGNDLIAIQNGIRPHRVVGFTLSADGASVTASRVLASSLAAFDEPTLGVVHEGNFYFVANSHWNRFDRENRLPAGLSGPTVLKIPLAGN